MPEGVRMFRWRTGSDVNIWIHPMERREATFYFSSGDSTVSPAFGSSLAAMNTSLNCQEIPVADNMIYLESLLKYYQKNALELRRRGMANKIDRRLSELVEQVLRT